MSRRADRVAVLEPVVGVRVAQPQRMSSKVTKVDMADRMLNGTGQGRGSRAEQQQKLALRRLKHCPQG